jgi:protein-disulfide isomerase
MKRFAFVLSLVLAASLLTLDRLAQNAEQATAAAPIASRPVAKPPQQNAIAEDGFSFVGGNPDGDVTVVEYFDYRCGYCRAVRADLLKLIDEDRGVRLVLKEYPVLGKSSVAIAKVAMSGLRQNADGYWALHNALMSHDGQLTEYRAIEVAAKLGYDVEQLRRDMQDAAIAKNLGLTKGEGKRLGADGTPAFVIGGNFMLGAITYADMKKAVGAARSKQQAERKP